MRFTRTSARKAALSFAVVSALFEASASATTKTWFGFFTGEWGEPVNWSTFVTPNASDTAVFNPGDGSRDIYLNAAGTASILLVNGTASAAGPFTFTSHNGAFLTCGTVQINSSVNANTTGFTGLALQVINLDVIDNSTLNLSAGTNVDALHFSLGVTSAPAPRININDATLNLLQTGTISQGQVVLNSGGNLTLGTNATLQVRTTGVLQLNRNFTLPGSNTLKVNTGGTVNCDSYLDIVGTGSGTGTMLIDGTGASITVGGSGIVTDWANGSSAAAIATFSSGGQGLYKSGVNIAAGGGAGTLNINSNGGLQVQNGLTVGGSGTGTVTVDNGKLISDGVAIFRSNSRLDMLNNASVTFRNDATFSTSTTLNWNSGQLLVSAGRTLHLAGGSLNIGAAVGSNANIFSGSTFRVANTGFITAAGVLDVGNSATGATGGTLNVNGANAGVSVAALSKIAPNSNNFATIAIGSNGGSVSYNGGADVATNGGLALLDLQNGTLSFNSVTAGSTSLTVPGTAATFNIAGGALKTTGLAQFRGGSLVNLTAGTFSNLGSASFEKGSELRISGGTLNTTGQPIQFIQGGVGSIQMGMGLSLGSTLSVLSGGKLRCASFFDIGNGTGGGPFNSGTLVVDGAGSLYQTQGGVFTDWGAGLGAASIIIRNGGVASLTQLHMGRDNARSTVGISSGGLLTTESIVGGDTTDAVTINLTGGAMSCSSVASFGKNNVINLGTGGSINFGNSATFSAGSTFNWSGGTWSNASGTVLAFNGGAASFTVVNGTNDSGRGLSDGSTLRITSGGTLATNSSFDIGKSGIGTMLVDGGRFISTATPASGNYTTWGHFAGNAATITFQNFAVGSYGAGLEIGTSGGAATVNLQSSSMLNTASLSAGTIGIPGGVNLAINNAALNVTDFATLRNGVIVNYTSGSLGVGGQLTMSGNSQLLLTTGGNKVVRAGGLLMNGTSKLDLNDNDMIVGSSITPKNLVEAYVRTGRAGGAWTGTPGVTSTAAKTNIKHNTTLGVLSGAEYSSVGGGGTFSGQAYAATDTLIKYTYYGDTDFNGKVDFDDYSRTDAGFNGHKTGWLNGDFDYNNVVDFDDYSLIDLAFNTQSGTLRRAMTYLEGADRSSNGMDDPALHLVMQHFGGLGLPYAQSFLNAVPEPTSTVLTVMGGAALGLRRRRRA